MSGWGSLFQWNVNFVFFRFWVTQRLFGDILLLEFLPTFIGIQKYPPPENLVLAPIERATSSHSFVIYTGSTGTDESTIQNCCMLL